MCSTPVQCIIDSLMNDFSYINMWSECVSVECDHHSRGL